jgi:hypothetical protein
VKYLGTGCVTRVGNPVLLRQSRGIVVVGVQMRCESFQGRSRATVSQAIGHENHTQILLTFLVALGLTQGKEASFRKSGVIDRYSV